MSTYMRFTKHPKTGKWENAIWEDDYFGRHHYGVIFPDLIVYDPLKTHLTTEINAAEAAILNGCIK